MQVTYTQVYPRLSTGKTKAMAKVTLDDCLQLTGIRVVDGANGLFVSYPNDPSYKGDDFRTIFYPLTKELRAHIEAKVLAAYAEAEK